MSRTNAEDKLTEDKNREYASEGNMQRTLSKMTNSEDEFITDIRIQSPECCSRSQIRGVQRTNLWLRMQRSTGEKIELTNLALICGVATLD